MKILLAQFGANGDCLYATALARQIKHDYPDSHLTWATSSLCRPIVEGNPHVDAIWEAQVASRATQGAAWVAYEREILQLLERGIYDRVYLSQIWPRNFQRYDGTVRPSILRAYHAPITVPVQPVLRLTDDEHERVSEFVKKHGIDLYQNRILMECAALSSQSFVTPEFATQVAERLIAEVPDTCVILSSHLEVSSDNPKIVSGRTLSLRENAALTHHCSHFIGTASGLTVINTSSAARQLPMLLLLARDTSVYASFHHDFEYWKMPVDGIIEMTESPSERVADCIAAMIRGGTTLAKEVFHETIRPDFRKYSQQIYHYLIKEKRIVDAGVSLATTAARYGWQPPLVHFARKYVFPNLKHDPATMFPERRAFIGSLRAAVADAVREAGALPASSGPASQ
ncbi:glycosyltransferase family 9 protein [Azospirillum sp. ST 5-10]|uniref:glycosyltransferase family 9 protein n=1 Tax=unclassified Azospirillum TaxID=2630922 RepID=UPI003F4A3DE7